MKKFLLLSIIMLFSFFGLKANFVNKDVATKVATNFYYQATQSTNFNSIKVANDYTIAENGITYYYIFNINNGFVIVSAEDAMHPILGYSLEGNYSNENPSPEFLWWMSGYKDQINYAIQNKLVGDSKTQQMWVEFSTYNKSLLTDITIGPFVLSLWDQGTPYNELCPVDAGGPGGHVYAGCVATATGQLMNYYKYPLQGNGSHGYSSSYGYLFANYADSTYNWNAMPNQISSSCIPIASLLYQLGIAVNMMYGPNGSGAYSTSVPGALRDYFNYAGSTQIVNRSSYNQTDWENLLQQQLNGKMPMYYSGQGPSGGHAFVCDGYKIVGTTTSYHFNWGWSGSANGWFDINNLNPGGSTFNQYQSIIINSIPGSGYPYNCSGQKTLIATDGVFEDGSGNQDYQSNLNCKWLIDPVNPSGTDHISIKFDRFEITDPVDVVIIYDGPMETAPILATFYGGHEPTIGTYYNSTSSKMLVKFVTNGATSGGGWSVSYSASSIIHCNGIQTFTHKWLNFGDGSGPTYDYNNGSMCKWKINPVNATYVKFWFNEFNTELNNDKVMIYKDFSATAGNLIGTYSGTEVPDSIYSNTGKMYIIFTTNGSITRSGWEASYVSDGVLGITENDNINNISIFPNPAENKVNINLTINEQQDISIIITDLIGNKIYGEYSNNVYGEYNTSIDLSNFAKGMYIIRIGDYNKKLIIK